MNVRARLVGVCQWLVPALLMLASAEGQAAGNWELGKPAYQNECTSCHNTPGVTGGGKQDFPAGASKELVQSKINAGMRNILDINNINIDPLKTTDDTIINNTVSDIAAYLSRTTFPIASLSPSSFSYGSLSAELTLAHTFRVTNTGTENLTVTNAAISGGGGYTVNATGCTSGPVGFTGPNNTCDIIVTFAPPPPITSPTSFNNRTLTVSFSNTFAGSATAFPLNGTGLPQFTLSASLLEFTSVTAPDGVRHLFITDNKGDRIRICRTDASTFSFPGDFTLDAPFTLDPTTACYTTSTASTPPARTLDVSVRFTKGADGPRNALLVVRRVDAGGAVLGSDVGTVQLNGNPGALVNVDQSSLYDHPELGDPPGVEIDNDATLDRTVTLFSQGSVPLSFTTGSPFTIIGASASEYSVLPTGCAAIAGLPSGATSPTPSCVLTVRFNPAGLGTRAADLQIAITGAPTRTVHLNGVGIFGPRLTVSQASGPVSSGDALNFGTQSIGGLYPSRTLTLKNGGTLGDLEVVVPSSTSTPGFTVMPDTGCGNLTPAATCNVAVHFDPSQAQGYAVPLVIRSRAAGSGASYVDFTLMLSGQGTFGTVPTLIWTDSSGTPINGVGFGVVDVGSPSAAVVRLRNDGPGGVAVSLINAVGPAASSYIVDASACATLFETMSCQMTVQFAPGTAGAKSAMLQAVTMAGSPSSGVFAPDFSLTGTARGAPAAAGLVASASILEFEAVAASQSLPLELTVTNSGTSPVEVVSYDISAGYSVVPVTCPPLPFLLAGKGQCTLSVSFHPESAGASEGMLRVAAADLPTTLDVTLTGNARSQADVSSGGCTLAGGESRLDPTLWMLIVCACLVLWQRRLRIGSYRVPRTHSCSPEQNP